MVLRSRLARRKLYCCHSASAVPRPAIPVGEEDSLSRKCESSPAAQDPSPSHRSRETVKLTLRPNLSPSMTTNLGILCEAGLEFPRNV